MIDQSVIIRKERVMPRKKQEEKRVRILEAAARVFVREGFYNAKMNDVAQEAGVAHGTVYLYFESKESLLISLFKESLGELIQYTQSEIQKEKNAEDKLKRQRGRTLSKICPEYFLCLFLGLTKTPFLIQVSSVQHN